MQEKGPPPSSFSPQAYSQIEGVLCRWAGNRPEALLICDRDLGPEAQPSPFLLYLSPTFKLLVQRLAQLPQTPQICFELLQIRRFCQTLLPLPGLSVEQRTGLEQWLAESWSENLPAEHSQFCLEMLQSPQPEALIAELQTAWEAVRVAEHAKEEFMSLVSHELRTPLTSILGMSATLLRWAFGPFNDRQRDCIQTIHSSGEHLMEMIESILDLSQTASGHTALNIQPFSLQRLVKGCVQLFQEIAEVRQVKLRASHRFTQDGDDTFVGDAQRLQQIVVNLLDNAIKFTEAGGEVQLQLSREEASLKLEVRDTGIGISHQDRDRLFQRFQQLEDSHRRRFGGTGLGLAHTKQIVDLHGGRIEIDSHPGQGSCFTVWLPEQRLPRSHSSNKPQGEVVLLEEDDVTATLICELLTAAGFKVFWLVDSSTALEQIQMLHPIAVIVNLQFQGSGGEELVQHIHRIALAPKPKTVGLLPRELRESQDLPQGLVDSLVYTPLNPEDLVVQLVSRPASIRLL